MPSVATRAHSPRGPAGLGRARRLLNAAAMRLFDTLWEPLAVTVLAIVLFAGSL
jgi:hypothetical protein